MAIHISCLIVSQVLIHLLLQLCQVFIPLLLLESLLVEFTRLLIHLTIAAALGVDVSEALTCVDEVSLLLFNHDLFSMLRLYLLSFDLVG